MSNVSNKANGSSIIRHNKEGAMFDLLGARFIKKASAEEANNAFFVMEMNMPHGAWVPVHEHPYPEFFYVTEGRIEFYRLEDGMEKWVSIGERDSALAPASVVHALRNDSGEDARMLVVVAPGLEPFFRDAGTPVESDRPITPVTDKELEHVRQTAAPYRTATA